MAEPRQYPLFSQCGLNCGLCPMHHVGEGRGCPGCGGGAGAQNCRLRRCAAARGGYEYCFECGDFPCAEYEGITETDSFITHRNMITDQQRAQAMGMEAYKAEMAAKMDILAQLLEGYNDGRRKSMFCTAVNMLPLDASRQALEQIESSCGTDDIKERGKAAAAALQAKADELGISLKLNRKKK